MAEWVAGKGYNSGQYESTFPLCIFYDFDKLPSTRPIFFHVEGGTVIDTLAPG